MLHHMPKHFIFCPHRVKSIGLFYVASAIFSIMPRDNLPWIMCIWIASCIFKRNTSHAFFMIIRKESCTVPFLYCWQVSVTCIVLINCIVSLGGGICSAYLVTNLFSVKIIPRPTKTNSCHCLLAPPPKLWKLGWVITAALGQGDSAVLQDFLMASAGGGDTWAIGPPHCSCWGFWQLTSWKKTQVAVRDVPTSLLFSTCCFPAYILYHVAVGCQIILWSSQLPASAGRMFSKGPRFYIYHSDLVPLHSS